MTIMRKHFRLTEEFTYGTLLIQSAYLPVGQTPADGDWETEHTYDWDSPQETLRSLLSAMSDFAGALAGAQTANIEYASKIVTLNKQLEALEQQPPTPANESGAMRNLREELNSLKSRHNTLGTQYGQLMAENKYLKSNTEYMTDKHIKMGEQLFKERDAAIAELNALKAKHDEMREECGAARAASMAVGEANIRLNDRLNALQAALTEANNQRNELRSQLVTAQKAAEANPIYMSCMERDHLLLELDNMLRKASHNNNERSAAVALIRKHAVPMRLMHIQPTLAQCGNIMRAMLYMYYQNLNETVFTDEDKAVARRLHAFINAAKA